jgi:hypothetical protein
VVLSPAISALLVLRCGFSGFAPDGSLLVQVNRGGGDLYALTVSIP